MGEINDEDGNGMGHVDELDEGDELEIVQFTDDDGKEYTAAILAVLEVDDQDYAVLAPVEQLEDESGELELFLFVYGEDDEGNEVFSFIEDDAIFEKVRAAAAELLEEAD